MYRSDMTILVGGATGQQGGAVARHLLEGGWRVRALTRDANKPDARDLSRMGAEVVEGDMNDRASLDGAMQGTYGAYSVQNFWLPGVGFEGEVRQGKNMADAAKDAGVKHFVYSSVGGAERKSNVPHFESKWIIEEHIRGLGLSATVLRPVFFMDNFNTMFYDDIVGGEIRWAMRPDKPLQMIAVDDIGAFAAMAFDRPDEFIGKAMELAGDEITFPQAADILSRVTGRTIRYEPIPLETLHQLSPEVAMMVAWFNDHGYGADIPYLRTLHPGLVALETWLRKTGWDRIALQRAA